jgi:hypothetical protein
MILKNYSLALATALATALLLAACAKNRTAKNDPVNETAIKEQKATFYSGAQNTLNPYDSFGFCHNEGLDYITGLLRISLDTGKEAKVQGTISYIRWKFGTDIAESGLEQALTFVKRDGFRLTDVIGISGNGYTFRFLEELESILKNEQNYPGFTICFDSVKLKIEQWEQSVTADQNLPEGDRQKLLQVGSVARYSSCYWIHIFNKYEAGQTHDQMVPLGFWKSVLKVVSAVTADVAGAAVGVFSESNAGDAVSKSIECSADAVDMVTYCVPG